MTINITNFTKFAGKIEGGLTDVNEENFDEIAKELLRSIMKLSNQKDCKIEIKVYEILRNAKVET